MRSYNRMIGSVFISANKGLPLAERGGLICVAMLAERYNSRR